MAEISSHICESFFMSPESTLECEQPVRRVFQSLGLAVDGLLEMVLDSSRQVRHGPVGPPTPTPGRRPERAAAWADGRGPGRPELGSATPAAGPEGFGLWRVRLLAVLSLPPSCQFRHCPGFSHMFPQVRSLF